MDEPLKDYAEWKKPVIKDHVSYDSIYTKWPRNQTAEGRNVHPWRQMCGGLGVGGGREDEEWLPVGMAASKTDHGNGCATSWIHRKPFNCTLWESELHSTGISSIKLLAIRRKGNEVYNQWSPNFSIPKNHQSSCDKRTVLDYAIPNPTQGVWRGAREPTFFTSTTSDSDTLTWMIPGAFHAGSV